MNFIIYFLLISGVSIITSEASCAEDVLSDIKQYFARGAEDLGILKGRRLRLSPKQLGTITGFSVVFEGVYNDDIPVAIKIVWDEETFKREAKILAVLNATKNNDIEQIGLPRIYYTGPILKNYNAIAMTLFDGTLENYFKQHKSAGKLPDSSILEIFRQTVKILKYFNRMDVVHNDIKPDNIFFRVTNNIARFYISDFNIATSKGKQNDAGTFKFASANFFSFIFKKKRYAMDDLESLAYSMWHVSGIPLGEWTWLFGLGIPEGFLVSRFPVKKDATERVLEKLSNLENNAVREVFEFICIDEMLSGKQVPDYDRIITELDQAIVEVANPTWSK